MAPTGRSGANDAEFTSFETNDPIADAEADALGEPIGVVDVIELETFEPAASSPADYPYENETWFRWWYVPAVVVPLAGATAAFVLLRRRRQSAPVSAYKAAVKQSRDWLEAVRGSKATKSAVNALQQGAATVRDSAKSLPDTAVALRDRSGEIVGVLVTSTAAQQAAQGVRGAVDSVSGLWSDNAPKANKATRRQGRNALKTTNATRRGLFAWFVARQARNTAKARAAKVNKAVEKAKPALRAAQLNASKNLTKAKAQAAARSNRTAKRARKSVNRAVNRTQAFAFGALVTATITYARAWRKRMMEREMRETAGGRMVRD